MNRILPTFRIPDRRRFITSLLLALSIAPLAFGQEAGEVVAPKRVLFIGNSLTYFENLPQVVSAMAKARGLQLTARKITAGGSTLEQHWQGKRNLRSVHEIASGHYDAVVLQDYSTRPVTAPDDTMRDIGLFCQQIKKSGGTPYLYVTWALEKNPEAQTAITETYLTAARADDAVAVPVGPAWQRARTLRPDLPLYTGDGKHPAKLGAYLSACVFFAVLTGESPVGLPRVPMTTDHEGESIILMQIDKADAEFCQQIAEDTVRAFQNAHPDASAHAPSPESAVTPLP